MSSTRKWQLAAAADADPILAPRALRILIGDDDRDAAVTLAMILRHEGHQVRTAYGGRQVMAAAIEFGPEVFVLDLNMPEVSGWQIASTICARLAKPPLLIAITGHYTQTSDRILSQISGFNHYLVKPFEPDALLKLLEPLRSVNP